MAYNTSKGDRQLGDIKNEDDPDTQIDFGADQIALTTSGSARLTVTNVSVTSAVALTASAFSGDGSALQGITGSGGDTTGPGSATDHAVARFFGAGGKTLQNSAVIIDDSGNTSGVGNLTVTGIISGSTISGSLFVGDGAGLTNLTGVGDVNGPGSATDHAVTRFFGTGGKTLQNSTVVIDDSGNTSGVGNFTATGHISGSGTGKFGALEINSGVATILPNGNISGSFISASSGFVGNGSGITGLPSAAITTYNGSGNNRIITSVNGTTVNGEANLTFNGSLLAITGSIAGGAISGSFISASSGFVGSGAGLTNLPSSGVTGPASTTDRSISVFVGTNGQTVTGSVPTIDMAGNISMPAAQLTCNQIVAGASGIQTSGPVSSSAQGTFAHVLIPAAGSLTVSGNVLLNSSSAYSTTVAGEFTASSGIFLQADNKRLSVGNSGDFYIAHSTNTVLANQTGHLTVDVETSGKNLRLQLGDDAGGSSVQFRNNSGNTVASTDSLGVTVGSGYGLLGVASGSVSANDVIVAVGYASSFVKFSKASPNTLTHGRGPFYVAYDGAVDGGTLRALKSRLVTGLNTSTANSVGDAVYLHPITSGSYVYSMPNPTADAAHFSLLVRVGRVVNVDASNGAIMLEPPGGGEPLVGQVLAGGGSSTLVAGFGSAYSGSQGSCAVLATANTDPAPSDDDQIKSAFIRSDGSLQITLDDSSGTPLLTYTIYG